MGHSNNFQLSDFSPTQKNMQRVSNISILVMYCMYFLAALFGYLTFYGELWQLSYFFWIYISKIIMFRKKSDSQGSDTE